MFIEQNWNKKKYSIIGLDEVGRGPLAGPVVAGGAHFSGTQLQLNKVLEKLQSLHVTDSKKLTTQKRREIISDLGLEIDQIKVNEIINIPIFKNKVKLFLYECSSDEIDKINILKASLNSMKNCTHALAQNTKAHALFDGNKIPDDLADNIEADFIIKGDSKSAFIGLASIMAKEYRDLKMSNYARKYPHYGFEKHAGYPTSFHKEAIKKWGITPIHRKTFKGVKEYI